MAGESDRSLPMPVFDPPPRVLIVVAPYYAEIARALEDGARAMLARVEAQVETAAVPGALEIPGAIRAAAGRFDGFVALGCVIRGETSHYDIVAGESARGLMDLSLAGHAVGNGILTVDTPDQALVRARDQDKGGGAAEAALHLVALARRFGGRGQGSGFDASQPDILLAGDGPDGGGSHA